MNQSPVERAVLNIAAYRFVDLAAPRAWVAPLRDACVERDLKGTIIVAEEGINLFLAGRADAVNEYLDWLATDPRFVDRIGRPAFADLVVKRSYSTTRPFARLRVKSKPEIVTMRRPRIRPGVARAPTVSPERLAEWIARGHDDDGREVVLLDTRNGFEVEQGSFDGARHLGLTRFESFPERIDDLRGAVEGRTVVTFCTGGIRCEKAALHLRDEGFAHVVQLDGGILNYFERVGAAHWHGVCFVFDERQAVAPDLAPLAEH